MYSLILVKLSLVIKKWSSEPRVHLVAIAVIPTYPHVFYILQAAMAISANKLIPSKIVLFVTLTPNILISSAIIGY